MPKILEMKDINGELWVRVGKPQEFESGVSICSPDEWQARYDEGYRDAEQEIAALKPNNEALIEEIEDFIKFHSNRYEKSDLDTAHLLTKIRKHLTTERR